jgi:hypothetical protein
VERLKAEWLAEVERLKAEGGSQQKRADRLEMELLEVKRLIPADEVAARRVDSAPSPACADTIGFTANAILRSNQSKSSWLCGCCGYERASRKCCKSCHSWLSYSWKKVDHSATDEMKAGGTETKRTTITTKKLRGMSTC